MGVPTIQKCVLATGDRVPAHLNATGRGLLGPRARNGLNHIHPLNRLAVNDAAVSVGIVRQHASDARPENRIDCMVGGGDANGPGGLVARFDHCGKFTLDLFEALDAM